MLDEVHKITIQIRVPRGKDPGKVAIGHYVIADGFVVLTEETGRPVGDSKRYLESDGDARLIACRMLRQRQKTGVIGFDHKITYPRLNY